MFKKTQNKHTRDISNVLSLRISENLRTPSIQKGISAYFKANLYKLYQKYDKYEYANFYLGWTRFVGVSWFKQQLVQS